jgi:hypothetical protein
MEPTAALQPPRRKITRIAIAGLVLALLALAAATLSPWAIDALQPEKKPLDQVAVEVATRIKDRLAAKAKGQEYLPPAEPKKTDPSKWYTPSVIAAGVLALCIGIVSLVAHHDARLNAATIVVAASAIIFQYALMIAATLLLILLIGLILSAISAST